EVGMSWHPPSAMTRGARDIHDLDVLSELASLSEAAGVPLRHGEDGAAFLAKVARAQGVSLAGLEAAHADAEDGAGEEVAATEETASEEEHSPGGAQGDDEAAGEDDSDAAEDDNG